QGKVSEGPQATGEGTQIGTSKFNEQNNDNKYVGYFYEQDQVHGTKEPSTIYTYLNNWFESSGLKSEQYFNKIDTNAGFCGDRTSYLDVNGENKGGGTGTTDTYYGSYVRLAPGGVPAVTASTALKVMPTYNCSVTGKNGDLYTYSRANQGNKKLDNPVGLITADEVAYGGLFY
ncbi:MAG: hypothetical protein NC483_00255, partial [Ruminococcus sp.]|nr:hypothetical protein [Ruminococcus sp.]